MREPGPLNVFQVLEALDEHWMPRVVAQVNDHYLKVARVQGELAWHSHADEDELFLVLRGRLTIQTEEGEVVLGEGDVHVVPRGVRHNPVAGDECWILLFEPASTRHTGDVETPLTRSIEEQIGELGGDEG